MKIDVKFLHSPSVPGMDDHIETVYDPRMCIDEIPFVYEKIDTRNWESYTQYIFKKIPKSSKPVQYEFSHTETVNRCAMITMKGTRCRHPADPKYGAICPTHEAELKRKTTKRTARKIR
jgi:hypothetical protein